MELKGVYTALVTPFSNGRVDYGKLRELVAMQIEGGVDGIVPVGTTGESPTLSPEEHMKVITEVIVTANKRCRIMAGSGANSTEEAILLTLHAKEAGADCSLQVSPYYNKPTQEGLYRHFSTIADKCELPLVLYNVPGRTGISIAADTVARLAKNNNILGIKEASGSVERVSEIAELCDLPVMCGDDSLTVPMMVVGAKGVISVASNFLPKELKEMVDACAAGDYAKALTIHNKYFRLFKDLFIESNPIPVKAAMNMMGLIEEESRLPLCPLQPGNREKLKATLSKALGKNF
ncbi:MAG: 4-hydroxy-tetrahydrodipicolinate synthase [Lentisphaeria bacterium]|nr:4-hydroxy-tetrahydrodipicolinate synthase [Lentisphaeria bacterium]